MRQLTQLYSDCDNECRFVIFYCPHLAGCNLFTGFQCFDCWNHDCAHTLSLILNRDYPIRMIPLSPHQRIFISLPCLVSILRMTLLETGRYSPHSMVIATYASQYTFLRPTRVFHSETVKSSLEYISSKLMVLSVTVRFMFCLHCIDCAKP